jgi:hypothetical protein
VTEEAMPGTLRLRRSARGRDNRPTYIVAVDGREVGQLRRDASIDVPLAPGDHEVLVRGGRTYASDPYSVSVKTGDLVRLVCFPAVTTMSTWVNLMWGKQPPRPGIRLEPDDM